MAPNVELDGSTRSVHSNILTAHMGLQNYKTDNKSNNNDDDNILKQRFQAPLGSKNEKMHPLISRPPKLKIDNRVHGKIETSYLSNRNR